MKKLFYILIVLSIAVLAACGKQGQSSNTLKVGTIAGPETQLMEVAKKVAKQKFKLNIKIVPFSDYSLPNIALADGSIDANMFQHQAYLDAAIKAHDYPLVVAGKTFIYPVGIYSKTVTALKDTPTKSRVAIPNDPSNEARALLLLQKAGMIKLKPGVSVTATPLDIVENYKDLRFIELDAAQLPRALDDVALAVINTNYAVLAGLYPNRDALVMEDKDSLYANVIVVRKEDKDKKQIQQLVAAVQSKAVLDKANELFKGQIVAAFKVGTV